MRQTGIRYSEAFKRQVVDEIEWGKFSSIGGAGKAYGINGAYTVRNWVIKYGREALLPKKVRIETLKEQNELKMARKRIRELEVAVADAHIDYCLERSYLMIACERIGTDPETFKKKHAMTLSDIRRKKGAYKNECCEAM